MKTEMTSLLNSLLLCLLLGLEVTLAGHVL